MVFATLAWFHWLLHNLVGLAFVDHMDLCITHSYAVAKLMQGSFSTEKALCGFYWRGAGTQYMLLVLD